MSNFLKNGTVLPSGLMSVNANAALDAFVKSFQNYSLKLGIVVSSYAPGDPGNINHAIPEYDVIVMEQNADRGSAPQRYKNCRAAYGLGSIADYLEMTYRFLDKQTSGGTTPEPGNQDGAIVLLLCLNGMGDTGIIMSALSHPDRTPNIQTTEPQLYGEYNGVKIAVNPDGSTSLTFQGATNNEGTPTDSSQGNTVVSIATNGSFQVQHSTITFSLDRSGDVSITASGDTTIKCTDANINCTNSTVTASDTATVEGKTVKLGANAMEAVIKGNTFKKLYDQHIHPTPVGPSGPPTIPLLPTALSTKVETE